MSASAMKCLGEGDIEKLEIVGNVSIAEVRRRFRRHRSSQEQLAWDVAEVERYL